MAGTIFLTGANTGIGIRTTKLFLSNGWQVAATSRASSDRSRLRELETEYPTTLFVTDLDLFDADTIQPALDAAIQKFSRIDILINNAGFGQYGPIELVTIENVQKQFEANVYGQLSVATWPQDRSQC